MSIDELQKEIEVIHKRRCEIISELKRLGVNLDFLSGVKGENNKQLSEVLKVE